jgi:hypothetical protein
MHTGCRNKAALLCALCALSAVMLLLFSGTALASLEVVPSVITVDGSRSARKQFTLKVTNAGKEPLDCMMIPQNYSMTMEGLSIGVPDPGPRSATDWLSFSPAKFKLIPEASQQVKCTLVFSRTCSGGYYAIIAVRGVPPHASMAEAGAKIQFSFQSNVVVMAVAKGSVLRPQPAIKIVELKPGGADSGKATGSRSWQLQALVDNTGNVHAKMDAQAEIRDAAGGRVWSGVLNSGKGTVIPGFPRYFRSAAIRSLRDGNYVAGVNIRVQGTRIGERGAQAFAVIAGQATPVGAEGLVAANTGGVFVTPGEAILAGPAGARRFSNVTIKNQLDKPVSCILKLAGWQIAQNGEMRPCDPAEASRSAATWLEISPQTLDLAPGASGKVRISATIPEQGATGEYYAALLVEPTAADGSKLVPSSGMLTVLPESTGKPALSATGLAIAPAASAGLGFSLKARNDGNVRILPTVSFIVQDSSGKRVGDVVTVDYQGESLFPGVAKNIRAEWTRALANGKYTLVAEVSAGKTTPTHTLKLPFSIPLPKAKATVGADSRTSTKPNSPAAKPKPVANKPTNRH